MHNNKYTSGLWGAALLALLALVGCSEGGGSGGQVQGAICASAADCAGGLCVEGSCQGCSTDEGCAADPTYGVGATCQEGSCQALDCEVGSQGCTCFGNQTCLSQELSCIEGLCQADSCEMGQEGCACYGNGTCDSGLDCQGDTCVPVACPTGAQGCACGDDDTCDSGLRCLEGTCQEDAACPEGSQGCACLEGDACQGELTCQQGTCQPEGCQDGLEGCACRDQGDEEGRCQEGLTCLEDSCQPCQDGLEACPCDEEGLCQDELVCDGEEELCRQARTCQEVECVPHQICQEGEEGQDAACLTACESGFSWDPVQGACQQNPDANCQEGAQGSLLADCTAQNRACTETEGGATCGACLEAYLEEMGSCRARLTCESLGCASQNRACQEGDAQADDACGACLEGYGEVEGACQEQIVANCQEGASGSLLADCTAQNRACTEVEGGAQCGGCLEGYGQDPDSMECIQRLCEDLGCEQLGRTCAGEPLAQCGACQDGLRPTEEDNPDSLCVLTLGCEDITCQEGTYCVEEEGADAYCADWPCLTPDGEPDYESAQRQDTGQCVFCEGLLCNQRGETGRLWPYTLDSANTCICETEPGFYATQALDAAAQPCDEDGDGWVRIAARTALESSDPALSQNARCELRTINRVRLRNELSQEIELLTCARGLVQERACDPDGDDGQCGDGRCDADTGLCACIEDSQVALYETTRNDDQTTLDNTVEGVLPSYDDGEQGRRLKAVELNSLTKACVSGTGDFNDNDVSDLNEDHGQSFSNTDADLRFFGQLSYFVELYESQYLRSEGDGDEAGELLIREKSRCQSSFPPTYNSALDSSQAWRGCTRLRDADYDEDSASRVGHDFAQWSCDATSGDCGALPAPTDQSAQREIPAHSLCEEDVALPPSDGIWRGMNHHSQFKCVQIATEPSQSQTQVLGLEQLANSVEGDYQMNRCAVACPEGDPSCEQDCDDAGSCAASSQAQSGDVSLPSVTCQAVTRSQVNVGDVGFVSVRYQGSEGEEGGQYTRGCIDEAAWWPELCPGYTTSPDTVEVGSDDNSFGSLVCGCGLNYGGLDCDRGCATENLFYGGEDTGICANGYCTLVEDSQGSGRSGWWSCLSRSSVITEDAAGDPDTALRSRSLRDGSWVLRGSTDPHGYDRQWQCQSEGCDTGWSVR